MGRDMKMENNKKEFNEYLDMLSEEELPVIYDYLLSLLSEREQASALPETAGQTNH